MTSMEPPAAPAPPAPPVAVAPAVPGRRPLLILAAAQLVLGVVLGFVWLAWSPHSVSYVIDLGNGNPVIIPDESESLVAADGRFVVLTVAAGLLVGLVAWRLRALRGRLTLVTITVTSLVASLITKGVGRLFSGGHTGGPVNTAFRPHLELHANAALFGQALIAALVYTIFVGLTGDPDLGQRPSAPMITEIPARPDAA